MIMDFLYIFVYNYYLLLLVCITLQNIHRLTIFQCMLEDHHKYQKHPSLWSTMIPAEFDRKYMLWILTDNSWQSRQGKL